MAAAENPAPVLSLQGVRLTYAHTPEQAVLQGVDLVVYAGEWVAVVGANGSGKSTLGRVAAGLLPVSAGRVQSPPPPGVQLVLQNPDAQGIGQTPLEDVCFGLTQLGVPPAAARQRALATLQAAGLADVANTPLERLSGGQRQLLATTAALAMHPRLIVLDEPTAMLDAAAAARLRAMVAAQQAHGVAVVWMTQRLAELAYASRVVALVAGQKVFDGTPRQFFYADPPALAGYTTSHPNPAQSAGGTPPALSPRPSLQPLSFCRQLGWTPPLPVQVAEALHSRGLCCGDKPLTAQELGECVARLRLAQSRQAAGGLDATLET
ncbi:MAG: energy-coupling factor ABC transporter ATP-binding protein [Alicyclobacillus sp.]|nr:energy-coupling factor ABC transporter ATP-binding protein [Alicyclobacillus sp.]